MFFDIRPLPVVLGTIDKRFCQVRIIARLVSALRRMSLARFSGRARDTLHGDASAAVRGARLSHGLGFGRLGPGAISGCFLGSPDTVNK
ncbi:hypothetical protein [Paraburkholderia haematera]|uniref:hypothetical protein n=1 Tax=Paraburkholderia haematera TaxID=2793077 RepID=UPI001B8C9B34|nr:hypothetical protein [Paraburkholderia haematera]